MDRSGEKHLQPAWRWNTNSLLSHGLLALLLFDHVLLVYALVMVVAIGLAGRPAALATFPLLSDPFVPPWLNALAWLIGVVTGWWPVSRWLRPRINELIYGQYDNAYALLAQLNQQWDDANASATLLPTLAATLAATLNLPYVAIETEIDAERPTLTYGAAPAQAEMVTIPLVYRGSALGRLRVSARYPHAQLSGADLQLLKDLARQVGITLRAAQLTAALQSSRQQLVTAREEERRRIRRDLHDGLGPTLANFAMRLEQARESLPPAAAESDALLAALTAEAQSTIADVRRLVYQLRPPDLDEYGLLSALREYLHRMTPKGTTITLQAPETLPTLPAAVEVAAYRIVQEAVNNAVKHARASAIRVTLVLSPAPAAPLSLAVEICDNGVGLPVDHPVGIGLHSMRERAEELGGQWRISNRAEGGAQVMASLPLG